jgi:hypothetical protein
VIKWKCLICEAKQQTEEKPAVGHRLCEGCKVRHYQRLVDIYKPEGGFRLEEARLLLKAARKAVKA